MDKAIGPGPEPRPDARLRNPYDLAADGLAAAAGRRDDCGARRRQPVAGQAAQGQRRATGEHVTDPRVDDDVDVIVDIDRNELLMILRDVQELSTETP